jgi:hypothetical protein
VKVMRKSGAERNSMGGARKSSNNGTAVRKAAKGMRSTFAATPSYAKLLV